MENKIQQLTEKLYNEGVSKGKQASQQIIEEANLHSDKIVEQAKKEAQEIIDQANAKAIEIKNNSLAELQLASKQMIADLKIEILNLIIAKGVSSDITKAYQDSTFVKQLILSSVKAWSENKMGALKILVPQDKINEVEQYLLSNISTSVASELSVIGYDGVEFGFKISPKEGGYMISFTNEDFDNLLSKYVRPRTKELLYKGE